MSIGTRSDICGKCIKALSDDDLQIQETHRLAIDIDICLINKCTLKVDSKERKKARKRKIEEFTKKVSTLRNSGGGALFVHIQGLHKDDRYFSHFNELVDDTLTNLLENGELFVDSYTKFWLDTESYTDILSVIVRASRVLSTADFKTKVSSDENITRPTSKNVALLLFGKERSICKPKIRGIRNLQQESRHIQLKYFENSLFQGFQDFTETNFVVPLHYIWHDLRLKEYFTTFSKVLQGGSYFLGVREKDVTIQNTNPELHYVTKKIEITGVKISPSLHQQFLAGLQKVVQDNICASFDRHFDVTSLYEAKFHIFDEADDLYVLEVAVGTVPGCIFYEIRGPEAYRIRDDGEIELLCFNEWLNKIKETGFCDKCIAA